MTHLKIKNPEKVDVKTGFKGEYFTVPAGETKSLPEDLVAKFIDTYPFLYIVSEEDDKEVAEPVKAESKVTKKK